MTRFQVLTLRAIPTLLLLTVLLIAIFCFWFPGGYARLGGVGTRVAILLIAGIVIGPCLTAIVYRPGKPGLRSDIAVLAALELAVVGTMAVTLYGQRPAYTVFAVDRFEVVTAAEIDTRKIGDERLRRRPSHRPRLVYAEMPSDPEAFDRLLDETVLLGLPDIDRRPTHWKPYPAGIRALRQQAKPLVTVAGADDDRGRAVRRWLGRKSAEDFLFLPIRGRKHDAAMILQARIGYPVDILAIDPW